MAVISGLCVPPGFKLSGKPTLIPPPTPLFAPLGLRPAHSSLLIVNLLLLLPLPGS